MRVGIRGSISSLLVFVVLLGCAKALPLDGDWSGDLGLKGKPRQDPSVAATLNKVTLHFSGTGRFELLYHGIFYKGEVRRNETDANLIVDTVINRAADAKIEYKVKPINGVMEFTGSDGEHVTLKPKLG